jgi:hypothetical protein
VAAGEKSKKAVGAPSRFRDRLKSPDSLSKIDPSEFSVASNDPWSKFTQTDLYQPTRKSTELPELGPTLLVALLVVGTLLVDVFLYKRDLPPAATLSQAIKSRLVLFFADFSIVATIVITAKQLKQDASRLFSPAANKYSAVSYKTNNVSWSSLVHYVPVLGVNLFYYHIESLGPLNFLNQVFLFLINLTATYFLSKYVSELLPSD